MDGRTDIFPLRSLCVGVAPTSLARLSISENETIRATTRCFYRSILYNSSSVCWRVQSSVHFDLTVEARKERRLAGCHFDPTFARRRTIEIGKKGMKRKWKHKYIIKIELNAQRSFLLFLLAHFQLWSSSSEIVVLQDCALAIMANTYSLILTYIVQLHALFWPVIDINCHENYTCIISNHNRLHWIVNQIPISVRKTTNQPCRCRRPGRAIARLNNSKW